MASRGNEVDQRCPTIRVHSMEQPRSVCCAHFGQLIEKARGEQSHHDWPDDAVADAQVGSDETGRDQTIVSGGHETVRDEHHVGKRRVVEQGIARAACLATGVGQRNYCGM